MGLKPSLVFLQIQYIKFDFTQLRLVVEITVGHAGNVDAFMLFRLPLPKEALKRTRDACNKYRYIQVHDS
jgi:hypothetical protein